MLTNPNCVDMEEEWTGSLGRGSTRTHSVYQPATGEKHVLFYPTTSPTLSTAGSEEPNRNWNQANSHNIQHVSNN